MIDVFLGSGHSKCQDLLDKQIYGYIYIYISLHQCSPTLARKGVQMKGLRFSAAAPTYMMPYGVPSGGDWALDRYSAIFMQGTQETLIHGCSSAWWGTSISTSAL